MERRRVFVTGRPLPQPSIAALWILLLFAGTAGATSAAEGAIARRGFDAEAVDLGGLEARSAALLLSAQEAGGLAVEVVAIPGPGEGMTSRVVLAVDVDGSSLLQDDVVVERPLILEVYGYAVGSDDALRGTLTRAFRLDLRELGDRLNEAGLTFFGHIDLVPGDYSIRVMVLHRESGRLGLGVVPLTVPSWSDPSEALVLSPVSRRPVGDGVLVREKDEPVPPFPVSIGGERWVPSLRRELAEGAPAEVLLLGRGLQNGISLRLEGDRLLELELSELHPIRAESSALEIVATVLDPGNLAAGDVDVSAVTAGRESAATTWRVRDANLEAEVPEARERPARFSRSRNEKVLEVYREMARALVEGRTADAREILTELHVDGLGVGATEVRKRLVEVETLAAVQMVGSRIEGLVPVMHLLEGLYRRHHERGRYSLSTHTRQVAMSLADVYLVRSRDDEAEQRIAEVLVSIGGYLSEAGDPLNAESVFERALELQRNHPAALEGLGAILESGGKLEEARNLYEDLVKVDPEDPRARLHLAVTLSRLDKEKRARMHLDQILADAGEVPEWVQVVTAQELARIHDRDGRLGEAAAVLAGALELHPSRQRLRIFLASLYDRSGRPADASEVLDDLDPSMGRDEPSARLIYSSMPRERMETDRVSLREAAAARLAVLQEAVR